MPTKGSFALPRGGIHDCTGARDAYEKYFCWPWPHDDSYLRELAREVPSQQKLKETHETETKWLLGLMRESDNSH